MKFVVIAHDGRDKKAPERRMAIRGQHLEGVAKLQAKGQIEIGGALLDDDGKMVGSMFVFNFPSRRALDAYFKREPYVTGNVWKKITVLPFRRAV